MTLNTETQHIACTAWKQIKSVNHADKIAVLFASIFVIELFLVPASAPWLV